MISPVAKRTRGGVDARAKLEQDEDTERQADIGAGLLNLGLLKANELGLDKEYAAAAATPSAGKAPVAAPAGGRSLPEFVSSAIQTRGARACCVPHPSFCAHGCCLPCSFACSRPTILRCS